jgi:hypothetical protein
MEDADKFFTLVCVCDTEFCPADTKECPACHKMQGKDMRFDTDGFLARIYEHCAADRADHALDVAFDAYFNFWNRFDIMGDIYNKIDVTKLDIAVMIGFLTQTSKYSSRLPEHKVFFKQVAEDMLRRGETPERIEKLLKNREDEGNYWETMKMLGATGPMWGCRPEDK